MLGPTCKWRLGSTCWYCVALAVDPTCHPYPPSLIMNSRSWDSTRLQLVPHPSPTTLAPSAPSAPLGQLAQKVGGSCSCHPLFLPPFLYMRERWCTTMAQAWMKHSWSVAMCKLLFLNVIFIDGWCRWSISHYPKDGIPVGQTHFWQSRSIHQETLKFITWSAHHRNIGELSWWAYYGRHRDRQVLSCQVIHTAKKFFWLLGLTPGAQTAWKFGPSSDIIGFLDVDWAQSHAEWALC
jgi:hypothetical protein